MAENKRWKLEYVSNCGKNSIFKQIGMENLKHMIQKTKEEGKETKVKGRLKAILISHVIDDINNLGKARPKAEKAVIEDKCFYSTYD